MPADEGQETVTLAYSGACGWSTNDLSDGTYGDRRRAVLVPEGDPELEALWWKLHRAFVTTNGNAFKGPQPDLLRAALNEQLQTSSKDIPNFGVDDEGDPDAR